MVVMVELVAVVAVQEDALAEHPLAVEAAMALSLFGRGEMT